jgi:hypothetical protein
MRDHVEGRWYADVDAVIDDVLAGWVAVLRAGPDSTPRGGTRGVAERNLIRTLLHAAEPDSPDETQLNALVLAANRYGALQPLTRADPGEVSRQLGCLRRELQRIANERDPDHRRTLAFLNRIDHAISIASLAVIRGGHAR